jgi:putative transcriptional regulator
MKDVSFTSNEDTLRELLSGEARRNRIRLFAGYSGWGPGQLEAEMQVGAWQLLPADAATVFDMDPAQLWPELSNRKPPLQTMRRAPRQPYRPAPDVLSTSR